MLVGKPAPEFRMITTKDLESLEHEADLADYRGRWLVLLFYQADFGLLCPKEVKAFNAAVPALAEAGFDLLGVSTDGIQSHVAWMRSHLGQLDFPLASDRSQTVSESFGVLDHAGQSARAVFIIDPHGIVRFESVYDERVGRSVAEVLRVVNALAHPVALLPAVEPMLAAAA